jgi:enediyne polyketide synthase
MGPWKVSAAHAEDIVLAVSGPGSIGCDLEPVIPRERSIWRDLLGPDRFSLAEQIARQSGESLDLASTRVWVALECLKKAGASLDTPLILRRCVEDGWVLLGPGSLVVATIELPVRDCPEPLVFGVLVSREHASLPIPACRRI